MLGLVIELVECSELMGRMAVTRFLGLFCFDRVIWRKFRRGRRGLIPVCMGEGGIHGAGTGKEGDGRRREEAYRGTEELMSTGSCL